MKLSGNYYEIGGFNPLRDTLRAIRFIIRLASYKTTTVKVISNLLDYTSNVCLSSTSSPYETV